MTSTDAAQLIMCKSNQFCNYHIFRAPSCDTWNGNHHVGNILSYFCSCWWLMCLVPYGSTLPHCSLIYFWGGPFHAAVSTSLVECVFCTSLMRGKEKIINLLISLHLQNCLHIKEPYSLIQHICFCLLSCFQFTKSLNKVTPIVCNCSPYFVLYFVFCMRFTDFCSIVIKSMLSIYLCSG